jgi:hypothetical protein
VCDGVCVCVCVCMLAFKIQISFLDAEIQNKAEVSQQTSTNFAET